MNDKLFLARVKVPDGLHVRHYVGVPPALADGRGGRLELAPPDVLLVRTGRDGALLLRYRSDGTFCGDTWHASLSDAFEQAAYEYPAVPLEWREVDAERDLAAVMRSRGGR